MPLPLACALLGLVLLLAWGGAALLVHPQRGTNGVWAAAIAAVLCWISGSLALLMAWRSRTGAAPTQGVFLSMIFRMGLPLAGGLVLQQQGGWLAEAGIFGLVVAFYLVMLVVETLLSLQVIGSSQKSAATPRDTVNVL